jgi:hypothetical protein
VCRFLSLPLPAMLLMASSGKSRLLYAGFRSGAHHRSRVIKEGLHL